MRFCDGSSLLLCLQHNCVLDCMLYAVKLLMSVDDTDEAMVPNEHQHPSSPPSPCLRVKQKQHKTIYTEIGPVAHRAETTSREGRVF